MNGNKNDVGLNEITWTICDH